MKVNAGSVKYTGGKRKQGKVSMGSIHRNWWYKPETTRAVTVRIIENQYVRTADSSALPCQVRVKHDGFGFEYHVAYITEKFYDADQGCSMIRTTGEYFTVKPLENVVDFWIEVDSNKNKRSKSKKNKKNNSSDNSNNDTHGIW